VRQVLIIIAGLAIGLLIVWFTRRDRENAAPPTRIASGSSTSSATSTSSVPTSDAASHAPPSAVRRLDPAARKQLADQIAAARDKRRAEASASPDRPALPEQGFKVEDIAQPLKEAMLAAIPILAECYPDKKKGFVAVARLTLVSDPDLGSVIDSDGIKDKDDQPLDPKLEDCLLDTIETLALPPMGPHPGKVKLQYSFRQDDDE
jgi:hypothetical protein